ncbi:hypothetical protein ACFX12_034243 [Malus domestica]
MVNKKSVMEVIRARAARPNFRNNDDKVVFTVHGPPSSNSANFSSPPICERTKQVLASSFLHSFFPKPSNPAFKFLPFSDEWDDSDPDDIWEFWILICFHR